MNWIFDASSGAPAAAILLATILAVSVLGLYVTPQIVDRCVLQPFHLVPSGRYDTLVTSGFVHADLAHLVFNAFTFWAFGFSLERELGTPRFVALYVAGLLASSVATWVIHRRHPNYSSLGASGAILAVLFASILVFPSSSIFVLPIPVPIPGPLFAVIYLGFSVFASRTRLGRINHDAHVAGAITGVAFMAFVDPGSLREALQVWLS